jgi:hypothetical protein
LDSNGLAKGALLGGFGGFRHNVRAPRAREEVYQVNDAFFVDVPGLQDVRGGEVLLLRRVGLVCRRRDTEVAAFVLVQQTAEDGGRIEVRPWRGSAGSYTELFESSEIESKHSDEINRAYQHMKSMLPSMPTSAQVRIFPINP